jgi:hypothetical protein
VATASAGLVRGLHFCDDDCGILCKCAILSFAGGRGDEDWVAEEVVGVPLAAIESLFSEFPLPEPAPAPPALPTLTDRGVNTIHFEMDSPTIIPWNSTVPAAAAGAVQVNLPDERLPSEECERVDLGPPLEAHWLSNV